MINRTIPVALLCGFAMVSPSLAVAQLQCSNAQSIGCQYHPDYGWIAYGSAPRRSSVERESPPPMPTVPADPVKAAEAQRRYELEQAQRMDAARQRMLSNARYWVRATGSCREHTGKAAKPEKGKTPADYATWTRSVAQACLDRWPYPDVSPEVDNPCNLAPWLLRMPAKHNPASDLRLAYDLKARSCYWGNYSACLGFSRGSKQCLADEFMTAKEREKAAVQIQARKSAAEAAVADSKRGTCNLGQFASPAGPGPLDDRVRTLTEAENRCRGQREGGMCFLAAIDHSTLKIPQAKPQTAFDLMGLACRYGEPATCDIQRQSCIAP